MIGEIQFYEANDDFGFLSNFALAAVKIAGVEWPSSEHFYQAQKFNDPQLQRLIRQASTPDEAFSLSREYAQWVKSDWLQQREHVMRYVVAEKFSQNAYFAYQLVATGEQVLTEHSHKDSFWGDGGDGSGRNELGLILMDVRSKLAVQEPYNLVTYLESAKLPT